MKRASWELWNQIYFLDFQYFSIMPMLCMITLYRANVEP